MSSVRSKNTKPELEIRRRLFIMGFRYRLHRQDLVGKPDMVFRKHSTVVFVHGCFWHQHGCRFSQLPTTRREWWKKKLEGNNIRDKKAVAALRSQGWRILMIWECGFRKHGIRNAAALDKIALKTFKFLHSRQGLLRIPQLPRSAKKLLPGKRKVNGREKRR